MTTFYGISNCDTVKRARAWLVENGVTFQFHDYKREGVDAERLRAWIAEHGWTVVLNRSGTTFRALPDADKADLDAEKAAALMQAHPSLIKRPILERGHRSLVGFRPDAYAAEFASASE